MRANRSGLGDGLGRGDPLVRLGRKACHNLLRWSKPGSPLAAHPGLGEVPRPGAAIAAADYQAILPMRQRAAMRRCPRRCTSSTNHLTTDAPRSPPRLATAGLAEPRRRDLHVCVKSRSYGAVAGCATPPQDSSTPGAHRHAPRRRGVEPRRSPPVAASQSVEGLQPWGASSPTPPPACDLLVWSTAAAAWSRFSSQRDAGTSKHTKVPVLGALSGAARAAGSSPARQRESAPARPLRRGLLSVRRAACGIRSRRRRRGAARGADKGTGSTTARADDEIPGDAAGDRG